MGMEDGRITVLINLTKPSIKSINYLIKLEIK